MRTVFFGTPEIAVPCVDAVAARHAVSAVVCQPDRPQKRSSKPVAPPVKEWALARGIEVHQPTKLNDGAFEAWLRAQRPDVCTIAAYGRILKQPILDVPAMGFLNMHPSLLPRWRGPSPIVAAIREGDRVTGVSIMRLTLAMDEGDLLLQEEEPIHEEDDTVTLTERLAPLGGKMIADSLDLMASGRAVFIPQDETRATYCKLIEKTDGAIRWAEPAAVIHRLVRAMLPWPVAFCMRDSEPLRVYKASIVDDEFAAAPGTVVRIEKARLIVAAGAGALSLDVVQAPGKKVMAIGDYLRGHAVPLGTCLGDG